MGFLNPILLLGVLAAAVPLLIHLWSRRQAKRVDFSSLMFLLVAHRQNVRRIQLKNLLILLLRAAIITLIALALARPLLKNQFSFAGARAKTSAVVILDNSFSMGYKGVQGQRFEKAKQVAMEVNDSLRRGDSVAVILMSDIPDPIFMKLTRDLDAAKAEIRRAEISSRPTLVPPSLELAHDILETTVNPNKEIYLISDFGRNGWTNWGGVPNRSGAKIYLIPVGEGNDDNTSIEEVHISNQLIGAHRPVQFKVSVNNHSALSPREITLTLYIDDKKRRSLSSTVPARESIAATFTQKFESPGTHTGHVDLTPDRLQFDNRRYFALGAYGQIRVLCVGEQTLYLTLALNPESQVTPSSDYTILPVSCSAQEFEDFALEDYDVVVFVDVPLLTDRIKQQLQSFNRAGKSVVYLVEDKIDVSSYNRFSNWLPASLGALTDWQVPLNLSEFDPDHPIFDIFGANDFSGQYAPQFYQGLVLDPAEEARVIARLSDDTPFMVERRIHTGTAIIINVSGSRRDASNLMVNPHFVPLLQQTVLYCKAIQSAHDRNLLVGDTFTANYRHAKATKASVVRVGDSSGSNRTISIGASGVLKFDQTELPGIYQVDIHGRDRLVRDFFAVNVDPAESDLQTIEIQEAIERIGAQPLFADSSESLHLRLDSYRMGKEIWGELIILALIFMLIEGILSNHQGAAPKESSAA
ncbi:MAG: BatA domain-containing protein [Candidatus Poribacteria bacterium]|nr:BatA domain-containing protein [Candidatus Poribacteria bacterium]